jgi:hypothetical protein
MEIAHPQPEAAAEIMMRTSEFRASLECSIMNSRRSYSILSAMIDWPLTMTSMEMGGRSPLP